MAGKPDNYTDIEITILGLLRRFGGIEKSAVLSALKKDFAEHLVQSAISRLIAEGRIVSVKNVLDLKIYKP